MTIAASFKPVTLYHGTATPLLVDTQARYDELAAQGWTKDYQHQQYPTRLYREVEQRDRNGNAIDPLIQHVDVIDADHGLGPEWVPFAELPSEQARVAALPPPVPRGGDMKPVSSGTQIEVSMAPELTRNVVVPDAGDPIPSPEIAADPQKAHPAFDEAPYQRDRDGKIVDTRTGEIATGARSQDHPGGQTVAGQPTTSTPVTPAAPTKARR